MEDAIGWDIKKTQRQILSKEKGALRKDPGGRLRVCLIYPNTYFIGMSNLGFQTLYRLLNDEPSIVCERAFLPDKRTLKQYVDKGEKLLSIESQTPLFEFDILAFSISFEEDYINVPAILELSGIPVLSKKREYPLVIAGGCSVSLNPEPMGDVMDAFFIGEAEGSIKNLAEKLSCFFQMDAEKKERLKELSAIEGVYLPGFYEFQYDDQRIISITPAHGMPLSINKKRLDRINDAMAPSTSVFTPDTEFKNAYLVEVQRGCPRGCRFCAAGFIYLPPRWRDKEDIKRDLVKGCELSKKAGFVGAAVSEYKDIKEILSFALERDVQTTLSSLRADTIDKELLKLLRKGGYSTVTLAPETASPRLQRVINKDIPEQTIFESIRLISDEGFKKLKLYFMVGLPTETDEDARTIGEVSIKLKKLFKGGRITLSINPFIPKPFTPFQWHRFEDIKVLEKRCGSIKDMLAKEGGFEVRTLPLKEALVQAYISRGDRRVGEKIIRASKYGWKGVLKEAAAEIRGSVYRERGKDEILPWDVINHGIKKNYLWSEYQRGLKGKTTPPCDVKTCHRCGVC